MRANSCWLTQEMPRLFWSTCSLSWSQEPATGLYSESNSVQTFTFYAFKAYFDIIFLSMTWYVMLSLTYKIFNKILQAFLISPLRAVCPGHFSFLKLIIITTFDGEYKLRIYTHTHTHTHIHFSCYFFFLRLKNSSQHLVLINPHPMVFILGEILRFTQIKQHVKLWFLIY